ncbi:tRNA:m(4)X modification enzyme TRM13 [Entophlyctis luteolus]|nr:tRNA:m(4)X modification enzyme TRM13 [Entophlyctis luteolus]
MNIAVQLQNLAPPLAAAISATSPNVATIKSMVSTLQTVTTSYVAAANTIQTDAAADCASDSALVSEIANLQAHNAHFMSYVSGLAGSIFRDKFVQSTSVADMAYVSDNAGEITIIPQLIINSHGVAFLFRHAPLLIPPINSCLPPNHCVEVAESEALSGACAGAWAAPVVTVCTPHLGRTPDCARPPQPVPAPKQGHCAFWIAPKRRFCPNALPKDCQSSAFCTQHTVATSGGPSTARSCPHCRSSIRPARLDAHLRVCPRRPCEPSSGAIRCFVPDANMPDANMPSAASCPQEQWQQQPKHMRSLPQADVLHLVEKICQACRRLNIRDKRIETECSASVGESLEQTKSVTQINALIARLDHMRALASSFVYLEMGCGTAEFSHLVNNELVRRELSRRTTDGSHVALEGSALSSPGYAPFVLVDRAASRWKVKQDRGCFEKIRIDIKDFVLSECATLRNPGSLAAKGVVCISKHLCGPATDLALRCLVNYSKSKPTIPLHSILIALCCHHRCTFSTYCNPEFITDTLGFTESEFGYMCYMSSWGTATDDMITKHTERKSKRPKLEAPIDSTAHSDNHELSEHEIIDDRDGEPSSNGHFTGLPAAERRRIGQRCKAILDRGRMEYARKHRLCADDGQQNTTVYMVDVREYVDVNVTPENRALEIFIGMSSASPRLQEPSTLTASPISASATPAALTLLSAQHSPALPLPFLASAAAASSASNVVDDAVVLTVHAAVPPSVFFACPAIFLSSTPLVPPEDRDGDETVPADGETGTASGSSRSNAFVYAAILTSPESAASAKTKSKDGCAIWIWAIGDAAKKAQIAGSSLAGGPGKPDWIKTMDSPVQHIYPHASKWICVVHRNGDMSLLKSDLTGSVATKKSGNPQGVVVWTQSFPASSAKDLELVTETVNVIKPASGYTLTARIVRFHTKLEGQQKPEKHSITVQEFPLHLEDTGVKPFAFCYGKQKKILFIACEIHLPSVELTAEADSNSKIRFFSMKSGSFVNTIDLEALNLNCFTANQPSNALIPSRFAMQTVADEYIAIVGAAEAKGGVTPAQSADPASIVGKEAYFDRVFHLSQIEPSISSVSGPVICVTTSTLKTKPGKSSLAYSASVSLIPYYCPPVTLMSAFGKLANSAKFSLPNVAKSPSTLGGLPTVAQFVPPANSKLIRPWLTNITKLSELDAAFVAKIRSSSSEDSASLELVRWIVEKTALVQTVISGKPPARPVAEPSDLSALESINWSTLPIIEISQVAMAVLLTRCLSNPKNFYPSKVVQYLLRTGKVPARVRTALSLDGNHSSSSVIDAGETTVSLIDACIAKDDLPTLCMAIKQAVALDEMDIRHVVQYACCAAGDSEGSLNRRRATIDAHVKSLFGNSDSGRRNPEYRRCFSGGASFDGRKWFLEQTFAVAIANTSSDFAFATAMKLLRTEEVAVVLEWAVGLIETDARRQGDVARRKAALDKRRADAANMAVDVNGIEPAVAGVRRDVISFFESVEKDDLARAGTEVENRRQLWWLWDAPGKSNNDYVGAVCQAIDVANVVIDGHLTVILLTPSLQQLLERLKKCVESDLRLFGVLERRLNGCLSVFEQQQQQQQQKLDEVQKSGSRKKGHELRHRWKRMVAQLNDGVGNYAIETMTI